MGGGIENGMTYPLFYEYQTTEIELSTKIENFSSTIQVNAKLNIEVTGLLGEICMFQ